MSDKTKFRSIGVEADIDALATKEASDIAGQQSLIKDTVGWTGKNLLPFPYKDSAKTYNGVTYVYNSDNTITANGEATSASWRTLLEDFSSLKPNERYILSGCPSGGSDSSYYMQLTYNDGTEKRYKDYGDGIEFINTNNLVRIQVLIVNGYTANNLVFKPMLRRADITDPTYEPYHESVETMYEEEIHGVNLYNNSETIGTGNSVVSLNNNGGFTLSGNVRYLAAANYLSGLEVGENYIATIKVVPSNNSDARLTLRNSTNQIQKTTIFGTRAGIYSLPFTYQEGWFLSVICNFDTIIESTIVVEEVMVRKATIDDSTYRPYNHQAIQNQLNAQGVLGAKNLLPNNATSQTINGVTFTVNADKSVTVNGTATANAIFSIISKSMAGSDDVYQKISGKNVIFTSNSKGSSPRVYMSYWDNVIGNLYDYDGNGFDMNLSSTIPSNWNISIVVLNNTTVNNLTFYPMIRLASDPDDTYQPYAMTNRELTEYNKGFNFLKFLFNADGSDIYSGNLNDLHAGYAYYSNAAVNIPSNYYGYCITLERPSSYNYAVQIAINATGDSVNMYVRKKASNTWGAWKTVTMS